MATISILAITVRLSVDCRSDNATFGAVIFSCQEDPVHSWKAGPGEVMTVENKYTKLTYLMNWNENENEE